MKLKEFQDLQKRVPHYDADKLRKIAHDQGVDVSKATTIEEARAAILADAEGKLSAADREALAKERLAEMERDDKAKGPAAEPDEVTKTIRQVNTDFCREVPQELRNGGEVEEGHARFGGRYKVPDGTYRIEGSEWLYTFAGQRLKGVGIASAANKWGGESVKSVPNG